MGQPDAEQRALAQLHEPEVPGDDVDRVAVVGDRERETAREQQGREGHDEGRHPPSRDEHAVGEADGATHEERQGQRREALAALRRERREHRREGEDGAAGEVDAAADDDERHADGHERQERAGLDDVQEVVDVREPGPEGDGAQQRDHDEHHEGARALDDRRRPLPPRGGLGRPGSWRTSAGLPAGAVGPAASVAPLTCCPCRAGGRRRPG